MGPVCCPLQRAHRWSSRGVTYLANLHKYTELQDCTPNLMSQALQVLAQLGLGTTVALGSQHLISVSPLTPEGTLSTHFVFPFLNVTLYLLRGFKFSKEMVQRAFH